MKKHYKRLMFKPFFRIDVKTREEEVEKAAYQQM